MSRRPRRNHTAAFKPACPSSSQGQTADRVLIHVDTELGAKDLLNNRMAYVAVSRGALDAQIFTNDREKLPEALGRDVSQQSAHVSHETAIDRRAASEPVEKVYSHAEHQRTGLLSTRLLHRNANSASLTFVPTDFVRSGGFIEHRRRWYGDSGRTPPVHRLERQQRAGGGLRGCVS